ncbi:pullulanase [Mycobacterium sp. WMMD1722]|uniref:pullulanase n=1 Tax=Mycobacterium sp. WMMD1722 TaxID=3404117 RepID=UPI003BF4E86B
MEYCLGDGDGSATLWPAEPDVDIDGDGVFDAVGLDVDGDGRIDDALADLDGDGLADHAVLDLDDDDVAEAYFTDDGAGTWLVRADHGGQLRWFGLDGAEQTGTSPVDFDADGQVAEQLVDTDDDGVADRVDGEDTVWVDTDGDGHWDVRLSDADGDGRADAAAGL